MHPLMLIGAVFLAVLLGGYALLTAFALPQTAPAKQRLNVEVQKEQAPTGYRPRTDPAPLLTQSLRGTKLNQLLQWELLRAGLLIKPSEMLVICLSAGLTMYLAGLSFHLSTATHGVLTLAGLAAPWIYVSARKQHRQKLLITQLPEALQLVASSLRSGFSILRGISVAAEEMPAPISEEFRWVIDEVNVGVSMDKAFGNMTTRTANPDVKLMVTAIQIQSGVGGDLAEVLETTSAMIRERFQLTAEIAALTAEGRLSAIILGGLPIGLAMLIHMLNPTYLRPLVSDPLGIGMLIAGGSLMLLGLFIINSMLNVDV